MLIDLHRIKAEYAAHQQGKRFLRQAPVTRSRCLPRLWHYDYLSLKALEHDLRTLIVELSGAGPRVALDVGSGFSPYRHLLEEGGYRVETLDPSAECQPTYVGTVDALPLADGSIDLILCTQVLEHVRDPWKAMKEFCRVLRPGGQVIFSVPHVWFYHPHPDDYYRFTPEGVVALCEAGGFAVGKLFAQGGTVLCAGQILAFLMFGVLGIVGAPLYLMINAVTELFDRLLPNALFSINFACRACKSK